MKRNWNFMLETPLDAEEIADREAEAGDMEYDLAREDDLGEG